jgi:ketosteroid isomerase-like protein
MTKTILVLLLAAAMAPGATDGKAEKEVLTALDAWKQAAMKKDAAAFDKVLHPDLMYGHSGGTVEGKELTIKHMVESKAVYEGIDISGTNVKVSGNMAMVTCRMDINQSTDGKRSTQNLSVFTVWLKGPQGWQMIGRQATHPTPPAH